MLTFRLTYIMNDIYISHIIKNCRFKMIWIVLGNCHRLSVRGFRRLVAYDRVPFVGGINLYLDSLARKGGCQSTVTYLLGGDKEPGSSGTPFETSLNLLRALSNSKTNPFRS